jgi:hypothetical protein
VDFKPYVDDLFRQLARPRGHLCDNPITGGGFVYGEDPLGPQKRAACRALVAREWFAWSNPGLPTLPLSAGDRADLRWKSGIKHLVAEYPHSLMAKKYDTFRHPSFVQYARGVMASAFTPDRIKNDPQLLAQYPPRALPGLGIGLCWSPPKRQRGRRRQQHGRCDVTGTAPKTPADLRS